MTTERTQVGREVEAALSGVLVHVRGEMVCRAELSMIPPQSTFLRYESV